jgi:hypothetical protein
MNGTFNRAVFLGPFCILCVVGVNAGQSHWIRSVRGVSEKYEPFVMETVAEESGHIIATASYADYRDEKESRLPAVIEGIQAQNCSFWPHVTTHVGNNLGGEWKTIEATQKNGEPATVTLERNRANLWLHIDLDCFRAMIGKFKYGRVTLTNGRAAIFEMRNLLPPSRTSEAWNTQLLHPEPDRLIQRPFVVAAIDSMGEDLRAVCAYVDVAGTSATSIEGTQTSDGDFWPYVTAQVADDYQGLWRIIGQPHTVGKPTTLLIQSKDVNARLIVDLETFRPLIGKFRYGRIVLRNGKAAMFELKNLLPPEKENEENTVREGKEGKGKEGVKSKHLTLAIGSAMRKQWRGLCA